MAGARAGSPCSRALRASCQFGATRRRKEEAVTETIQITTYTPDANGGFVKERFEVTVPAGTKILPTREEAEIAKKPDPASVSIRRLGTLVDRLGQHAAEHPVQVGGLLSRQREAQRTVRALDAEADPRLAADADQHATECADAFVVLKGLRERIGDGIRHGDVLSDFGVAPSKSERIRHVGLLPAH